MNSQFGGGPTPINVDEVLSGNQPIATIFNGEERISVYLQDGGSVHLPKNLFGLAIGKGGVNIKQATEFYGLRNINLEEQPPMMGDNVGFRWRLPRPEGR